ncbi:MAG: DUF6572 domain-containing protein [Mycobacterium sp.]
MSDDALFDPTKVDLVSVSPDGSTVILHIVNDYPWSGTDAQIQSLQAKVHTYVGFALDGQLVNTYPETAGLAWTIRVDDRVGGRDDRSSRVLTQLAEAVRRYGGDLVVA